MINIRLFYYFLITSVLTLITPYFIRITNAHPLAPSLLEITEVTPRYAEIKWKTPINTVPGNEMLPQLPPQCAHTRELGIKTIGTALVRRLGMYCDSPLVESTIGVSGIGDSKANVILRIFLLDGRKLNTVLTADNSSFVIPERESSLYAAWSYLKLGFEHILGGVDHLLFILGLMLIVSDGRQLLFTLTAFTIGHSITLSLAVLGFVNIPQAPVEALIAFSILILAIELTRGRTSQTLMRRFPWAMALGFGLLHGLGFAGALSEVGLPDNEIPLSLLFFNIGIEVGQLLFISVILALRALINLFIFPLPARSVLLFSYIVGSLSAFWFFERMSRIFENIK